MRRKGVPCGCTDNGGCCGLKEKLAILWDRTIGSILKINNQTPDGDGNFRIQGGDNIEVSDISNGIEIGIKNPLTDDVTIQADLTVDGDIVANGDIIQNGSAYETHAEKIYTNDDYIVMREGAVGPLGSGDFSGFQVTKYDGTNDGRLVVDRDGTARVGDVGDEQPLATRDESADLTDGHLLKWDATNLKLVDTGVSVDDVGGMEFLAKGNVNVYVGTPYDMQSVTINLPSPAEFTSDYDYMVTANVLNADDYSVMDDVTISLPNNTVTTPGTSFNIGIVTGNDVVVFWYVYRMKKNHTGLPNLFGSFPASLETQPKLVSGTNIKTVGGQSLLGSGDIPAGGLTWTKRTVNNNWSDIFDVTGTTITAKKDIILETTTSNMLSSLYIPKGKSFENTIDFKITLNAVISGAFYHSSRVVIISTRISTGTNFTAVRYGIKATTDGTTVTLSTATSNYNFDKSDMDIYVGE